MEGGNKGHVKQLASKTGRLYANTTIKSMRNRLLLICWKPQLSFLRMLHRGVNAVAVPEQEDAVDPSNKFRQMLGSLPIGEERLAS